MKRETENLFNIPWQVKKYEDLTGRHSSIYFDVDDFEEIIEYYLLNGDYIRAKQVAEYAGSVHPSSIPLMLKKAQLLASFNKETHALELLTRVEDLDPTNHDIFLTKGAIYSQMMNYEKAIEEYNKAVYGADEPDFVYCNIAFEYENMGNFDKTIEYLNKALEVNPDNDLAIYEAAYCFDLLSLTEEGISFFRRLIERNPYSTEAWFNLGVSYINAGLYEKALDALEYSLAIDQEHEHSWFHKGYTLSLLNRHTEAIAAYRESMDEDESDAMKFYYIGECHEKLEDYHEAKNYYLKCTRLDPELADAWVGISICEIETGQTGKAVNFLEKAINLDPENVSFLCLLGSSHFLNKEFEKGSAAYEKALGIEPNDEETWLEYAEALIKTDDIAGATKVTQRAVETLPGKNGLLYLTAALLFARGKAQEGSVCLEEAHQNDPNGLALLMKRFPKLCEHPDFTNAAGNLCI